MVSMVDSEKKSNANQDKYSGGGVIKQFPKPEVIAAMRCDFVKLNHGR